MVVSSTEKSGSSSCFQDSVLLSCFLHLVDTVGIKKARWPPATPASRTPTSAIRIGGTDLFLIALVGVGGEAQEEFSMPLIRLPGCTKTELVGYFGPQCPPRWQEEGSQKQPHLTADAHGMPSPREEGSSSRRSGNQPAHLPISSSEMFSLASNMASQALCAHRSPCCSLLSLAAQLHDNAAASCQTWLSVGHLCATSHATYVGGRSCLLLCLPPRDHIWVLR